MNIYYASMTYMLTIERMHLCKKIFGKYPAQRAIFSAIKGYSGACKMLRLYRPRDFSRDGLAESIVWGEMT